MGAILVHAWIDCFTVLTLGGGLRSQVAFSCILEFGDARFEWSHINSFVSKWLTLMTATLPTHNGIYLKSPGTRLLLKQPNVQNITLLVLCKI